MMRRNVMFNERTHGIHTLWSTPGLDSSHIEDSKDEPISMGHLILAQSFPTDMGDQSGGPPIVYRCVM